MRWAILPGQPAQPVGFRAINTDADLQPGEVATSTNPAGKVLDADGTSLRAPTSAERLAAAKVARLDYLRERRNRAIEAGIEFNGREYWTDRDAILDLASALVGFLALTLLPAQEVEQLPVPQFVPWKTRAGYLPHSPADLVRLYAAISQYRLIQHQIEDTLIAAVGAATTIEQVAAVDWPA